MALAFTEEEFDTMVQELLYREPASFDMLCSIAQRALKSSVFRWCAADPCLRGHAEDVLQEIYIRLIQTTVTSFLLRSGADGPVNRNPEGFRNWMFRVARNLTYDYAACLHNICNHTWSGDEELPGAEDPADFIDPAETTDALLSAAVEVVLEADVGIYKSLTWLAQSIFVLQEGFTRIRATRVLEEQFSQKQLRELWQVVQSGAQEISWMRITREQFLRIEAALNEPYDTSRSWGQVPYKEYFMKKGGRASISDWVNRIDTMIKRVTQNETLNG